jgi:Crinkler effector protein N-terminal domain
MSAVATPPSATLQLFCYMCSNDYRHAFEVKIGMEESVVAVRKAIKENESQFRDIDADSLVLWSVKIPSGENLKEIVDKLGLADENSLSPCRTSFLNNQLMDTSTSSRICLLVSTDVLLFLPICGTDATVLFFSRIYGLYHCLQPFDRKMHFPNHQKTFSIVSNVLKLSRMRHQSQGK